LLLEAVLVLIEARLGNVAIGASYVLLVAACRLLRRIALARDVAGVVHTDLPCVAVVVVLNIDIVVYIVHMLLL